MDTTDAKAWRCTVCGFVHRGSHPPDTCPVCGVDSSSFEALGEVRAEPAAAKPKRWVCAVCGYVHEGSEPPGECPLCGAGREQFQPAEEEVAGGGSGAAVRVVIVGAGIAGLAAAEAVRAAAPRATIRILSAERELPYYRLNLTRYLAGEVGRSDLPLHAGEWYADQRLELGLGEEATGLDLAARNVELKGGGRVPFDKLILASGAHPFVPPLPGGDLQGVVSVRTLEDADRLLELAKSGCRCVCLGGGLLGLETAGALARRGVRVTVVESFGHLMPSQLDPRAGGLLGRHLGTIGVELRAAVHVKALTGTARVTGVVLEEGDTLPADVVVLATGVRSNSFLARQAGLEVKKGIVVDNHLCTSHPNVLAAGDAVEHLGVVYGNWSVAQFQGRIAGMNAAGVAAEFSGVPRSHTLKILGLDTFSIGQFNAPDGSFRVLAEETGGAYRSLVFRDGVLVGANLVGDASLAGMIRAAMEGRKDFTELLAGTPSAAAVLAELRAGA